MRKKIDLVDLNKENERILEDNENIFWLQVDGEKKLATENLIPGNQVYNEKLIKVKGIEYRTWDPFRSKLAASIFNGLNDFPFKLKSDILYLGVSTGTTVSHISDIISNTGTIISTDITPSLGGPLNAANQAIANPNIKQASTIPIKPGPPSIKRFFNS